MTLLRYQHIDELPGLTISEAKMSKVKFEPHFHLEFHIGLVAQGALEQSVQGQKMSLLPGQICIVPPGEVHDGTFRPPITQHQQDKYELSTFRISAKLMQEALEDAELSRRDDKAEYFIRPTVIERNHITNGFLHLKHALSTRQSANQLHIDSLWSNTLTELLSYLHMNPKLIPTQDGLNNIEFKLIRDYCLANLHEKINLDDLSEIVQLTRFQLLRRFQKRLGIAPHAWLTNLRLESARHNLLKTNLRITDISSDVGFYDQSHFNRAFKKAFRVSPSQFRAGEQ
ncbi:AraC family transcriptional regulator [Marinomonas balearica]|uniref:AraC family transcriptional regulator n=1 Tax=Marinomonas balearica TaxID=491947 RepID=A0A4R6M3Z4_9GAMM|nr:AraC family transcriptional regulator [Marinomonas balearica]TDO95726.1 AraC family transcriptional regulator [Marinomonas balearica]